MRSIEKTDEEWKETLTPEQYRILRQKGTEWAFSGKYWNHHEEGDYRCAGCGTPLFKSEQKFDSRCGWPSFYDAVDNDADATFGRAGKGYATDTADAECAVGARYIERWRGARQARYVDDVLARELRTLHDGDRDRHFLQALRALARCDDDFRGTGLLPSNGTG